MSNSYLSNNHIRDWRNGVNVVRSTLGSNNKPICKASDVKSQTNSPGSIRKRERVSTFWNDHRDKRKSKSPSKDTANSIDRMNSNYCSKRKTNDKGDIQKYIKYKQKLDKEKRFETDLTIKSRKENIQSSLNNLQNFQHDRFSHYKSFLQTQARTSNENYYMKSNSMSSLQKPKLPAPIYDELEKAGLLEYTDYSNHDHPFMSSLSAKYKNGLNSTVDSGIETGEWHRSLTPDKFRNSHDRINEHNSFGPRSLTNKPLKKSVEMKTNKKCIDTQFYNGYHDRLKEIYQEQISAYDASSENDAAQESDDSNFKRSSLSTTPSTIATETMMDHLNNYLNRLKTGFHPGPDPQHLNSKTSDLTSKRIIYPKIREREENISNRSPGESTIKDNYKDLEEALYNAQIQLNSENGESEETMSEKISQAVQNFIKIKEALNDSARSPTCTSGPIRHSPNPISSHETIISMSKISSKSESNNVESNHDKEFLPESKCTEMDLKKLNETTDIDVSGDINEKTCEENLSNIVNNVSTQLFVPDISENIPSITAFKQDLESRHKRANELIKLTKDLHRETKRITKLEKKAFKVSKPFISLVQMDNKHQPICKMDPSVPSKVGTEVSNTLRCPGFVSNLDEVKRLDEFGYPETSKMTNASEQINYGYHSNKSPQTQSSVSENDEITISISDITTTLTDQSELEARLIALQSEIEKKKQIVTKLKKSQKDRKRDKIKQKETVLQKQIEMYDKYIDKLQTCVDQISSKVDDNLSDDSHTLTGSTNYLNDLDKIDKPCNQDDHRFPNDFSGHGSNDFENNQIDGVGVVDKDNERNQDITKGRKSPDDYEYSLDLLIENNKHIDTDHMDFDSLYIKEQSHQNELDDVVNDNENKNEPDRRKKSLLSDELNGENKIDFTQTEENGKQIVSGAKEIITPLIDQNYLDISVTLKIEGDRKQKIKDLMHHSEHEMDHSLDGLVQANDAHGEMVSDDTLQQLYLKEFRSDPNDDEIKLDDLVLININTFPIVELQQPVIYDLPILEMLEPKSPEQKIPSDSKEDPTRLEIVPEITHVETKVNNVDIVSNSTNSVHILNNDQNSQIGLDSASSSVHSDENSMSIHFGINQDKSFNIFIPKFSGDEKSQKNQVQYEDASSNDGSSVSDMDSMFHFVEEASLNQNLGKSSPQNITTDLQLVEDIVQPIPIPSTCQLESIEMPSDSKEMPDESSLSNGFLSAIYVEELVDNLLNKIILSELENIKPILVANIEQKKQLAIAPVTSLDFMPTSFLVEDVELLPPIQEKIIYTNDVLKSDDLWELSDLTTEDPWKIEREPSIYTDQSEANAHISSSFALIDKESLREKISWLIPLKSEYMNPLIDSAIKHLYDARKNRSGVTEQALLDAFNNLPQLFFNNDPKVTESEITSSFYNPSIQQPYVDKRIIFNMILEVFLEIYAFEKHFPQSSWTHSSFMMKSNIYSLWKGHTPPESYDLVIKIVREHIDAIINQKNTLSIGDKSTIKDNNQSKIIKWCIKQQKDDVDRLLITDLQKEENQWIYYDEAEEEVKIQVAEEIFDILMLDTITWIKSISSPTPNC